MISLEINGQKRPLELEPPTTLSDVLNHLGVQADRVAVELNDLIVSRSAWDGTPIDANDRIEIVQFVGGGCRQS